MITKKHGTVLIFDEVITGFRLSEGGASKYSGVQDAETSAIFSKSILPHFNFRTTSEKTGTHGTNVLAIWIG